MSHAVQNEKPNVSSSAALWAVLIFVGLIIAAINFVQAEGADAGHGEHGAATEHHEAGAGHGAAGTHEAQGAAATHGEAAAHEGTGTEGTHEAGTPAGHEEKPAAEPAHEEAHH